MRLAVLGPTMCVADDGIEFVPSRRDRALLAALAVDRARVRSVDELAEAVWGDLPPPNARKLVRNRISAVRTRLGPSMVATIADGYRLGESVVVDADRFLAGAADAAEATALLAEWRGHPFVDVEDWAAARPVITRLQMAYSLLVEAVVSFDLGTGDSDRALLGAEALVALDPYRERFWDLLARALYAGGRQREALEACHRARRSLGEVGLDPGPELITTERLIVAHDPSLRVVRGGQRPPPSPIGQFVGRHDDVTRLEDLVRRHRLVTVVGLGGVGKTRLVIELARRRDDHPGAGVVIADLTAATNDEDVAATVARTLGLPTGATPANGIRVWAAMSRGVLVLDNAEHVRRGAAELAHLVAEAGAQVHVLVTSRTALDTDDEVVAVLAPLVHADAVALFDARSSRTHSRSGIDQLCAAVGGVPLAIELAAGRADAIAPGELATRLSDDPTALDRSTGERHASVTQIVEWSIASLIPPVRNVLAAFAVFRAPFTLEAGQFVAGVGQLPVVEALATLVRHSLIQVRFAEPTRYRLLELVRASAGRLLEQNGQRHEVETRLSSWAASIVDRTRIDTGESIVADIPNLDRALRLACDAGDVSTALHIARALMPLSFLGRTEPRAWAIDALALRGADTDPLFARVGGDTAWFMSWAGQFDESRAMARRVIECAPFTTGAGWAHHSLAVMDGDDTADERSLSIAREHGDALLELSARSTLALRCAQTHPELAMQHGDASSERARRVGLAWAEQIAAFTCGVARTHSDPVGFAYHLRRAQFLADGERSDQVSAITRVMLLGFPDPTLPQLKRDLNALERILTTGIDSMAPIVLLRLPGDLVAAGRLQDAAEVADFVGRELPHAMSDDVRTFIGTSTPARGGDAVPTGRLRSSLDVLRLLDDIRQDV